MDLNIAVSLIAVMSFLFGIFNYVVIKPLTNAIESLKNTIIEMKNDLKENIKNHNQLNIRLSVAEDKIKNLENRLEGK